MGGQKKVQISLNLLLNQFSIYILLVLVTYIIFKPALTSYFFQDDWFTFSISRASNLKEFLAFFVPRTDIIYYRPIGMQIYFFMMNSFFGVNSNAFRWSAVLVNALNSYLMYRILLNFQYKKYLSLFGALFYAGSVALYIPFYWSATFPFILGPLFFLASFLSYISRGFRLGKYTAFIFFILGMLTLENTIILPVILFLWGVFYMHKILLKEMIPYITVGVLYVILRTFIYPVPLTDTYKLSVNLISTIRTYLLWLLNWPEEIGRQMVGPFTINPLFIRDFSNYVNVWVIASITILLLLLVVPLVAILIKSSRKIVLINRGLVFSLLWIALSVAPLVMFSNHTFPYYLPVSLFGFILFIINMLSEFFAKIKINSVIKLSYLAVIIIFWFWSGLTVMNFNSKVHWAPRRASEAQEVISKLTPLIKPTTHYIVNIKNKGYYLPLNNQDALHVVFGENVETVYGEFGDISL